MFCGSQKDICSKEGQEALEEVRREMTRYDGGAGCDRCSDGEVWGKGRTRQ